MYSDADIVLSQDWVPPVSIMSTVEPPLSAPPGHSDERVRKHAVSFSLDTTTPVMPTTPDKKNKVAYGFMIVTKCVNDMNNIWG